MDIDEIPLVTFYAERTDFMISKPPILDLVDLNITHWQSSSDQRSILTVARFPMLAGSGVTDEDNKLKVGPRQWLFTSDAQGKYYYVEPDGKAIAAGRDDLSDLENQMSSYGAEFLKKRPGTQTATARALDSAEATSPLQDMVLRFIDAMNQALTLTGKWADIEEPGFVTVNAEFGLTAQEDADLRALTDARKNRDLSRRKYLNELRRRGTLPVDFDAEENDFEIERELSQFSGVSSLDLDPNADVLGDEDDGNEDDD